MSLSFWVYILRCSDGSYYTGHTDDIDARLVAHKTGMIKGYTSRRLPVTLVFCEEFSTREDAFLNERRIKGWSRKKKEALIDRNWDELVRLSKPRSSAESTARPSTGSG